MDKVLIVTNNIALAAIFFSTIGLFYIKAIYKRKETKITFLARTVEVTGVIFTLYLISLIINIIFSIFLKTPSFAIICLLMLLSPFILGKYSNEYEKADKYVNIQIALLVISFLVLIIHKV